MKIILFMIFIIGLHRIIKIDLYKLKPKYITPLFGSYIKVIRDFPYIYHYIYRIYVNKTEGNRDRGATEQSVIIANKKRAIINLNADEFSFIHIDTLERHDSNVRKVIYHELGHVVSGYLSCDRNNQTDLVMDEKRCEENCKYLVLKSLPIVIYNITMNT